MSPLRRSDRAAPLLLLLLLVLFMYCLRQLSHRQESSRFPLKGMHYVQLGGEVPLPGVYAFPGAPSVNELMVGAGVHAADGQRMDSHSILSSGERLDLKRESGEVRLRRGEMSGFYKMALGIPLSINSEPETGLSALPFIGPTLARVIVEERSRRGGFRSLEDLTEIPGIGVHRFQTIKPFIRL